MGKGVDGDPVGRITRCATDELPCSLGVVVDEPFEEAEGEPAGLELGFPQQAVRDFEPAGGPIAPRRFTEAPLDRLDQGPADPMQQADPGGDPTLPVEIVRIRESREPIPESRCERTRIRDLVGKRPAKLLGGWPPAGDERVRGQ